MTQPSTPELKQVETALQLSPDTFAQKNYYSVFDVVRQSRKQFANESRAWLGGRGGKAWDLCMGQAQHIRRLFQEKKLTRQVRQNLPRTLSGQPVRRNAARGGIQGLVQDGPDWQNQFTENWQAYCQAGAPEAYDSPVSYLTWLNAQAEAFEQEIALEGLDSPIISLQTRRPDLNNMMVDNDAINQTIPALQLVNEILESSIAGSLPDGKTVDETLAATRYPTLLPYHFPHDQTELSLLNAGVPLEDIIGQTSTDWPWFLSDTLSGARSGARSNNATELASRLAPEQQTIITEPQNTASTAFYTTNFGLATADYTPFVKPDTFTYQLGIAIPQVEQLLAGNEGDCSVVVSTNVDNTTYPAVAENYGASFINQNQGPAIALNNDAEFSSTYPDDKDTGVSLTANNVSQTEGLFNGGIFTAQDLASECYIPEDLSIKDGALTDFSLVLWFKVSEGDVKNDGVIATNKTGNYAKSGRGISVLFEVTENGAYQFYLNICDGSTQLNSMSLPVTRGEWTLIALVVDTTDNTLYLYSGYASDSGVTAELTLDYSTLNPLTSTDGSWGFNGNKGNSYYHSYPDSWSTVRYDDITVWGKALTMAEVNDFIASHAAGGGSSSMTHHYLLDAPATPPAGNDVSDTSPVELFYLSDARMDRINRIVRLQRWLGLSFEETDLLLSACIAAQGGNNTDYSLNSHTLRALGVFRHWQQKYTINAFQFAAVLHQLTPYALSPAVPFFDQVFNSPSLFDKPFAITGATINYTDKTGDSSLIVRQICAGLSITQAQFRVLADKVAAQLGDASKTTFPLTLDTVSAFYRLATIPRWLGLTFADGAALFSLLQTNDAVWTSLSGIPQLTTLTSGQPTDGGDILDILMALDAAADWAKDHSLSWLKNYLDLHATPKTLFASAATVNFVNHIKQQLPASVLSEQSFTGVLQPDGMTTGWMDILTSLIDANGLVLPAATDYDTIASLVSDDIDTANLTYDSDADKSQAISTLTGIIFQAKLTQSGIADSALSQMFNTQQSLSAFLLQWSSDSEYRLLFDSLTMNNTADITNPTTITGDYLGYLYNLGQRAGIATQFNLTPAAISVFLAHPDWLDAGYTDLTLSLSLLYRFSRYGDWLVLASKEDAVLAYLSWVNTAPPPATATAPTTTTAPTAATASAALAVLLDWDSSEVALATGALDGGMAKTVAEVDYVMRLKSLSAKTGLSVTPLLDTGALIPGNVSDTWDDWHSAGESLVAAWTDAN